MELKKIAWVEDDIDVIYPVVKPLEDLGFQILTYYSYGDACDHLEEILTCDLIMLDLILPSGNHEINGEEIGLELLKTLRIQKEYTGPIVVFSVIANTEDLETKKVLKGLKVKKISKPVRPSDLKKSVLEELNPEK